MRVWHCSLVLSTCEENVWSPGCCPSFCPNMWTVLNCTSSVDFCLNFSSSSCKQRMKLLNVQLNEQRMPKKVIFSMLSAEIKTSESFNACCICVQPAGLSFTLIFFSCSEIQLRSCCRWPSLCAQSCFLFSISRIWRQKAWHCAKNYIRSNWWQPYCSFRIKPLLLPWCQSSSAEASIRDWGPPIAQQGSNAHYE